MSFAIAAAYDLDRGMSRDGAIPWDLPAVRQRFHTLTLGQPDQPQNIVILGRRAWESFGEHERPLPGRMNIVLTSDDAYRLPRGVVRASSVTNALHQASRFGHLGRIFIIGGANTCRDAILHPECADVYITEIGAHYGCDTFFPLVPAFFREAERTEWFADEAVPVRFVTFSKQRV